MRPTVKHMGDGEYVYRYTVKRGEENLLRSADDLMEAVEEWAKVSLYYPYHDDRYSTNTWECHEHSFEHIVQTLLHGDNAKHMTLEGFEEYYGKSE